MRTLHDSSTVMKWLLSRGNQRYYIYLFGSHYRMLIEKYKCRNL